jgi:acyl-CoA thioesterase-1
MLRNILLIILVIAIAGVVYIFAKRPPDIRNYPPKDGPIVALGDSLAYGTGSTVKGGFVTMLSNLIKEPIENYGVPGDTAGMGLERLNDVIRRHPRIALVLLGGNDFLDHVDKATTFASLRQIVTKLQADGAVVIILGIRGGVINDPFADSFASLAKETKSAYVPDVLAGLIGDERLMADAIHPNDEGYKLIARKVYPVLSGLLR